MPRNAVLASVLLTATLASCGTTTEEPAAAPAETSSPEEVRTIVLTEGSMITIAVDPQGGSSITVRIPDGHAGAGTYTSTSPHMLDDFHAIQETLGQPGVAAWIQVDGRNEIIVVSHEVTLQ